MPNLSNFRFPDSSGPALLTARDSADPTKFPTVLEAGTRLGPYEIVAAIGGGGMGQVYRAHDTRLGRDVAIKVLPSELAKDAQFRLRFEREAKTISRLSHPNICTLFDVGENYLVMELLEGESLAERLLRGPLPMDELLSVAVQIADALGKAHREGVVHRDLKPANVMTTKDGAKLLDFGLATDRIPRSASGPADMTVLKALTAEGAVLGTFPYMAPEQVAGEEPDVRSDIFALGAVLYEMATGRRAFQGMNKTSLIAAIVAGQPTPMNELQPLISPALTHVVSRCLAKDPDLRWQNASDVAEELRWIAQSRAEPPAAVATTTKVSSARWAIAAVSGWLLFLAAVLTAAVLMRGDTIDRQMFQTEVSAGNLAQAFIAPVALSPDGTVLATVVVKEGAWFLNLRNLQSGQARVLDDTEGASFPFWSPDGRSVAFFANGKLKTVNIESGATQVVCDAPEGRGGTWNQQGVILFAPDAYSPLFKVPATGGARVAVTTLPPGDKRSHRNPYFLPDGEHFLFSSMTVGSGVAGTTMAGSLRSGGGETVLDYASTVSYADNHLFSVRNGTLLAHGFNADDATVTAPARALATDVDWYEPRGTATFSAAGNVLVYSAAFRPKMRFSIGDPAGNPVASGEAATYKVMHVSPDGRAATVNQLGANREFNLRLMDLSSATSSQLFSTGPTGDSNAIFSPDGARLFVDANMAETHELWTQPVGGGPRDVLLKGDQFVRASDWSRDGKVIIFERQHAGSGWDIEYVRLDDAERRPMPFLKTAASETAGRLSPDQRWLAFVSDEGGSSNVYVTPFPSAEQKWRISVDGGSFPRWGADGRRLYYLSQGTIQSVDVRDNPTFVSGQPRAVETFGRHVTAFDVTRDGRIVALSRLDERRPLKVVVDWSELVSND
jgi:eukaryotic-like serine/threonine-protein kinase